MIKFHKVMGLPAGPLEPNSFYFVLNNNVAESYLTNSSGVAKAMGNTSMVESIVNQKISEISTIRQVATIAARDSDKSVTTGNTMYLVTDATGDATVTTGAALYFYNKLGDTFTKLAEYESMDVVLNWNSIQGKPNSTPSAIDDAVSKVHSHSNMPVLNALTDSSGKLAYNGNLVETQWNTSNW